MKQLKFLAFAWLSCLAALANAEPQLGKEYGLVAQAQPTDMKKIEVTEIFSYACPHCFHLEPIIAPWAKKLPKDVVFTRMHAVGNPSWLSLGKLFYALEALGEGERLHGEVFNAMHVENVNLSDEKVAAEWVSKHGVDAKKFADAYASFGVQGKVARSKQLSTAYGINGVPTIVVAGKYQTSAMMAGGHENALKTADYLINLVRRERGGK
jgi:thiol:disulfide interchange protein DsbA